MRRLIRMALGDPRRWGAIAAGPVAVACVLALATIAPDAGSTTWATLPDGRFLEVSPDAASKPDAPSEGAPIDAAKDAFPVDGVTDVSRGDFGPIAETSKPIPPDPTPLVSDAVFVITLRFDKGALTFDRVRREVLAKPGAVPRHFGRFAAELYVGPTLIERLRFDIPLLGDDSTTADVYEKGLVTTVEVRVPDSDRPTKLELWDRATDKRWVFPYPPKPSP